MIEEFSAPPCPDEQPEIPRWQKRPPMPAVKPRRDPREHRATLAELVEAARPQLAKLQMKGKTK